MNHIADRIHGTQQACLSREASGQGKKTLGLAEQLTRLYGYIIYSGGWIVKYASIPLDNINQYGPAASWTYGRQKNIFVDLGVVVFSCKVGVTPQDNNSGHQNYLINLQ